MPERYGAAGKLGAAGETVQHGREGALPALLLEDACGVGIGFARVDHKRQAAQARRRDMGAKAALLRLARAVVVVIVQAGFADRDHFRMPRMGDEVVGGHVEFLVRVVRMGADRAVHIGKSLGDRQYAGKALHAGRDRDHARQSGGAAARHDRVKLAGEVRKIQMAVTVDQHRHIALCY